MEAANQKPYYESSHYSKIKQEDQRSPEKSSVHRDEKMRYEERRDENLLGYLLAPKDK